ncbi:MAG: hypothetical protein ACFCUR_15765 [Rhodomicrobiaceae bacterium]
MPTLFDPVGVFRIISDNPDIFGPLQGEMRKQAQALMEKGMKAKSFSLAHLRRVEKDLGGEELKLFVDAMKVATVQNIAKKFDPHHPKCNIKPNQINAVWARDHVIRLASGEAEPEPKLVSLDKLLPAAKRSQEHLVSVYRDLGSDRFAASLAAMSATAPANLIKKIDPTNPQAKGKAADVDARWARSRLAELASDGDFVPAAPEPASETPKRNLFDEAHRVYSTKRRAG